MRYGHLSPGQQVAVLVLLKVCLDLPDVASICVYLAIRRHLTAAVQPQQPEIDNASAAAAAESPFGGIYVGDNEVEGRRNIYRSCIVRLQCVRRLSR